MNTNENAINIRDIADIHDVTQREALRIVIQADHEFSHRSGDPIHVDVE